MLMRRIPWVTVLVLGGVASGVALAVAGNDYEWSDPQPPLTSVSDLASRTVVSDVGLTLESPGAQLTPLISGEQAVKRAWEEEGAPGDPQGVHATFALLTWGSRLTETPVWVVTYEGADCMLAAGPAGGSQECAKQAFNTIMDASSGEYIASFTSPDSGGL